MAKQIVVLALIFFAAVGIAAATASTPSTSASVAPTTAEADEGSSGDNVIGTISGGTAADAAPVGGPVPDGVFPNLAPAPAPSSGAAALEITTAAGAMAAAGIVGSFFF